MSAAIFPGVLGARTRPLPERERAAKDQCGTVDPASFHHGPLICYNGACETVKKAKPYPDNTLCVILFQSLAVNITHGRSDGKKNTP